MRFRRPIFCAIMVAPLLSLSACEEIQSAIASVRTEQETQDQKARRSFAERPSPARRMDLGGVDEAFMIEAPETGSALGWGWSATRGQIIPTVCIDFDTLPDTPEARAERREAQTSTLSLSTVSDSSELSQSMNISSSVSVKTVGYKASGKAKFASNTKVSSFSTTIVVNAEVMNSPYSALPKSSGDAESGPAIRLTADAAALARRNLDEFQEVCGEGYVSTLMRGAEAYAVIEVKTSSRSEQTSMKSSLSGEGMGVKVKGAFGSSGSAASQNLTRDITFYQAGGSGNDLPVAVCAKKNADGSCAEEIAFADESEAILWRIQNLAKDANEAPKTFSIEITPYHVLENFPRGQELIADTGETDEIALAYGLYRTAYNDITLAFEAAKKTDVVENTDENNPPPTPLTFHIPVAICPDALIGNCERRMMPLDAAEIVFEIKEERVETGVSALNLLGALQDVALIGKDLIEIGAAECLEAEEDCAFDVSTLRSIYAARSGMPIPSNWVSDLDIDVHTGFNLRGPAQAKCAISSLEPGCISNAEVESWAQRSGFTPVTADEEVDFQRVKAAMDAAGAPYIEGDADRPDALTLWVPPAQRNAAMTALNAVEPAPVKQARLAVGQPSAD